MTRLRGSPPARVKSRRGRSRRNSSDRYRRPWRTEYRSVIAVAGSRVADATCAASRCRTPAASTIGRARSLKGRYGPPLLDRTTSSMSDGIAGELPWYCLNGAPGYRPAPTTVEVNDGVSRPRISHRVLYFLSSTDPDGFYRLPAFNRAGQLELTDSDDGVNPRPPHLWFPSTKLRENLVNIVLN